MSLAGAAARIAGDTSAAERRESAEVGSAHAAKRVYPKSGPGADIRVIRTEADFLALEADWNALFERAGRPTHVFQQFNWLRHSIERYHRGTDDLCVAVAYRGDRLVVAWPLRIARMFGVRHLMWLGEPVGQYGDCLIDAIDDGEALALSVWQTLLAEVRPDAICLRRVRDDANAWPILGRLGAKVTERNEAQSLDLAAAGSFETFYAASASKRLRRQRARKLDRLDEELGPVSMCRITDPHEAAAVARQAVVMKRIWLEDKSLASATLADDRALSFFEAVASDARNPVGCEVSVMRAGEHLIGVQIGFLCKGRLSLHMIVYNTAHHRYSPGALQMADTVERAFSDGLDAVDYLAPAAAYKSEWSNRSTAVCDFALCRTLKGRLLVDIVNRRLRPLLKTKIVPRLPRRLRMVIIG